MGGLDRIADRKAAQGAGLADPDAEALLRADDFALLLAVLYDQQMRAETAFAAPHRLRERLGHLDPATLAQADPDTLGALFAEKPAVHRFPAKMAAATIDLAAHLVEHHDADAARLWHDDPPDPELVKRARRLPGFGPGKAHTLLHALAVYGRRTRSS